LRARRTAPPRYRGAGMTEGMPSVESEEIRQLIVNGIPEAEVRVSGDGRHFEAVIISDRFAGKNTLQQHRMVYTALGDRFDTDAVHALSIKTYTRKAWESLQKQPD
jgi:acid stress-induced BolA-like protein IbaG/YrbA